jgi:predicted ATPase
MEETPMVDKRLMSCLKLRNFLSYGDSDNTLDLLPLNILIGRNASGKTNLLEAIEVLRATPSDLTVPFREGGGIANWLWNGVAKAPVAEIEAILLGPESEQSLLYRLHFTVQQQRLEVVAEVIDDPLYCKIASPRTDTETGTIETSGFFHYRFLPWGVPEASVKQPERKDGFVSLLPQRRSIVKFAEYYVTQSVLSQLRDRSQYPEITFLATEFGKMRSYREWSLGRFSMPRSPQPADLPVDFLMENAQNLGLVLNDLQHRGVWQLFLRYLKRFQESVVDITTKVEGGTVQIFLREEGATRNPIPATRLSDGMLKYLCLLSILCHPSPPPLVCLEEPELGMHPDILPTIAELLLDASQRTQLIVTTHSDVLVSALSEHPECIVVCERDDQGTHLRRLEAEPLKEWLDRYSLGELWRIGEIGGV